MIETILIALVSVWLLVSTDICDYCNEIQAEKERAEMMDSAPRDE